MKRLSTDYITQEQLAEGNFITLEELKAKKARKEYIDYLLDSIAAKVALQSLEGQNASSRISTTG